MALCEHHIVEKTTKLCDLPTDLFASLTPWLSGVEITRLWLCGNYQIHVNLKAGYSVTEYRIKLLESPQTVGYTSLLVFFRQLRVLDITFPDSFHPPCLQGFSILNLPPTLQEMTLEADQVHNFFASPHDAQTLMTGLSAHFPDMTHLTLLSLNIGGWVGRNMDALPNSLRFLTLEHLIAESGSFSLCLPYLETFSVLDRCDFPASCVEKLPSRLKHLYLPGEAKLSLEPVFELPKELETLHIFGSDALKSNAVISVLPRSLRVFSVSVSDFSDGFERSLPPDLTTLRLGVGKLVSERSFAGLPRSLTSLLLTSTNCIICDHGVEDLPRSLKELSMPFGQFSVDCAPHLPPSLTSLIIPTSDIPDEFIRELPRSLLELDVQYSPNLTNRCVSSLPPLLTKLSIGYCDKLTDKACGDFPRTLKYLYMHVSEHWNDPNEIGLLPPSLLSFQASELKSLSNDCIPALPRTLTELIIPLCMRVTADCVPDLPPNLTHLTPAYLSISTKYSVLHGRKLKF